MMGLTEPRMPDKTPDKRELILGAARELFLEQGFHETRVEDIAARAGIGKGTVYTYFPSKRDLLVEIIRSSMDAFKSTIFSAAEAEDNPRAKLEAAAHSILSFGESSQPLGRLVMESTGISDKELKNHLLKIRQECIDLFTVIITQGIDQGLFRPVNPRIAAQAIHGAMTAVFHEAMFQETWAGRKPPHAGLTSEDAAQELLSLVFTGLNPTS